MRLKKLVIENFRGYKEKTEIEIENALTALLGQNDVGKSAILEALEIFFNNETVKIDAADKNVYSANPVVSIACIFDEYPNEIDVDEGFRSSFTSEYLVNPDNDIEIIKEFKIGATAGKPSTYIYANHPTKAGFSNLHTLKITDLRKIGKDLDVEDNVSDKRAASLWRKAIWDACDDLELSPGKIDISDLGKESKSLYSKIDSILPTFALFKSDRASEDGDPEAKNPIQAAVNNAKRVYQTEIESIQQKIEEAVMDVAKRTLEKIEEMDPNLASELTPRFKDKPKWTFNFTLDGEDSIPINKRGSGVRRLILLNFFRAEAEKKRTEDERPRVIYAIEEPETSQHPNYQRMLVESLIDLSKKEECQILITTHVPALAELLPIESVRFIERSGQETPIVQKPTDEVLEKAATTLGVLPEKEIATAGALLLVEGHGDIVFLHHTSEQLKADGQVSHSLKDKNIATIPIGGCGNLKHWVTMKLADQLGLEWGVILDSDIGNPKSNADNVQRIAEIKALGKIGILTRKREPENYIDPTIIQNTHGVSLNYSATDDAKKIIARATKTRENDVLTKFWPKMVASQIVSQSTYTEAGTTKVELVDIINEVLTIPE